MEPKLIRNKVFNNQKKVIVMIVVVFICLFIGTSYSLLTSKDETEEVISFTAGELNLEVKTNTDTSVNLPDELPKSEEEVEKPIILNIKNSGSLTICEYRLKLIPDTSDTTPTSDLPTNYIRYAISLDNGASYRGSKLLSETNNQIYIGLDLKKDATKTIYVKVWLDETALDNEEVLNKHFYGKIDAELLQRCETPATEIIKATIGETGGIIGVTTSNTKATTDSSNIREYRYSGLGVNNYVTFNDETWRIIGVFKDESGQEYVKIVRNEVLPADVMPDTYVAAGKNFKIRYNSSSTGYWDYEENNFDNNWDDAGLMYWLNSKGTDSNDLGYLNKIKSPYTDMICETKWYLGTLSYIYIESNNYGVQETPIEAYKAERAVTGCTENKGPSTNNSQSEVEGNSTCRVWANNAATWDGKIALMYPSDMGFSTDSEHWSTTFKYGFFNEAPKDTSWLQKEANHSWNEWFLSPNSYDANMVSYWNSTGNVHHSSTNDIYGSNVRPTLYLKSDTVILSGTGEQNNPYQLG